MLRPTSRTASLDDFYTLFGETGERNDSLESLLGSAETAMAALLRKGLNGRTRIAGRPSPDDVVVNFCALLISRNPAMVDRMKVHIERETTSIFHEVTASKSAFRKARREYEQATGKRLIDLQDVEHLRGRIAISATKAGGLLAIGGASLFADKLAAMTVDFLFAPEDATFITSDVPYVLIGKDDDPGELDQVLIPLSASLSLVFNKSDRPSYECVDTTQAVVRAVNRAMLIMASDTLISKSPEVFSEEVLQRWATADESGRLLIVRELIREDRCVTRGRTRRGPALASRNQNLTAGARPESAHPPH